MRAATRILVSLAVWWICAGALNGALLDDDPLEIEVDVVIEYTSVASDGQIDCYFLDTQAWEIWDATGSSGVHTSDPQPVTMYLGKEYTLWVDKWNVSELKITLGEPEGYSLSIAEHGSDDLILRNQISDNSTGTGDLRIFKVKIEKESVGGAYLPVGESSSWSRDATLGAMRFGLGRTMNGGAAGSLRLGNYNPIWTAIDPSSLIYTETSIDVHKVLTPTGTQIHQVYAPQTLADVEVINSSSFDIRFYSWSDVAGWNGTEYTLSGSPDPIVTYTITKSNAYTMTIRKTVGSTYWETKWVQSLSWPYAIAQYDWTKNASAGSGAGQSLRYVSIVPTNSSSNSYAHIREYGRTSASGGFTVSSNTYKSYYDYGWGRELVSVKEGYTSASVFLTETQFEYYTDESDGDGHYRQLKKVTRNDGGYTRYVYYDDINRLGQMKYEYSPFQDQQERTVKYYAYGSDGTGENYLRTLVTTTVDSEQVGKVITSYSSETKYGEPVTKSVTQVYSSSSIVASTTTSKWYGQTVSEPYLRGRPFSIVRPDGTATSHYYYNATSTWHHWAYHGTTDAHSETAYSLTNVGGADFEDILLVNNKSYADVTITDLAARDYHSYMAMNHSGTAFQPATFTERTYDGATRVTFIQRSPLKNGSWTPSSFTTLYEASYNSSTGQLGWTKDQTGERTDYEYDTQGRVNKRDRLGVGANGGYEAIETITTRTTYDGSNRVVQRDVSDDDETEIITSTWEYDTAGRLTEKTIDCCDTVTYAYSATQTTTTNDDGGTIIEDTYLDGSLKQRSDTATTPLWSKTFAHYLGYLEVWTASQNFTESSPYVDNWSMRRLDWAGRAIYTRQPTEDGGSRRTDFTYNSYNQLIEREVRSGTESGGSLSAILSPYKYVYDSHGSRLQEGYHIDGSQFVASDEDNRIKEVKSGFYFDGDYWWSESSRYVYPNTGASAGTAVFLSLSRSRLVPDAGYLSHTYSEDALGNTITAKSLVDRDYSRVDQTTTFYPVPSGPIRCR